MLGGFLWIHRRAWTNVGSLHPHRDVLHPNRPNVSKNELRSKLADLYKADKNSVSVFGFRTQFGGGKSTGFALIYDSHDDLKKFEPHYRKVRYGDATKIEKPSRQQRMFLPRAVWIGGVVWVGVVWVADVGGKLQASNARTRARRYGVPTARGSARTRNKRLSIQNKTNLYKSWAGSVAGLGNLQGRDSSTAVQLWKIDNGRIGWKGSPFFVWPQNPNYRLHTYHWGVVNLLGFLFCIKCTSPQVWR